MKLMKKCIVEDCENERDKGYRYCRKCYLKRRAEIREQKKKAGLKYRTTYTLICKACGKTFSSLKKESPLCQECCKESFLSENEPNSYKNAKGGGYCWEHRKIAEEVFGRKLLTNEVIHHIDENPKNNHLSNLIVLSRSSHGKLHQFLRVEKFVIEYHKESWSDKVVGLSEKWLEENKISFVRLSELPKKEVQK